MDGFDLSRLTPAHLRAPDGLPLRPDNRDRFDRRLVAQAIAEDATFDSGDRNRLRDPVRSILASDASDRPSTP